MDVLPQPCARIVARGCQTHPLALLLLPSEARVDSVCVDDCDFKAKPKAAGEYNCRARRRQRGARRRGYSLEAHGGPWDCRASALAVLLSNAEGKCGPLWMRCASGSRPRRRLQGQPGQRQKPMQGPYWNQGQCCVCDRPTP